MKGTTKAPTGIAGFDEITAGGLPHGRTTLLVGGSGSGKTVLALHFLVHGARHCREPGIFVAFEESSRRIVANAVSFGWPLAALQPRKLHFVDAQPLPGKVVRIAGVTVDITERKLIADELRESDRRFSDMLGNVELLSVMMDREVRLTYCNIGEDITEQKRAEIRIKRLNRVYAVLSQTNALTARVRSREELFEETCRVAVEAGAFKMAWIGVIDPKTRDGKVVARFGGEEGHVEAAGLTAREGVEIEEQARLLWLLNCDEMQGYLLGKPVTREVFETRYLAPK